MSAKKSEKMSAKNTKNSAKKSDKIFQNDTQKQFEFDENVASVFDDMIARSVPFYDEMLNLCVYFLGRNLGGDSAKKTIYDLGSSSGNLLLKTAEILPKARLIGIDNAPAMIEIANKKARAMAKKIEFVNGDFLEIPFEKCDGVIANFTLQFVRPKKREAAVKKIFNALKKGGIFIMSEKVIAQNPVLDRQFIDRYLEFKKANGYSQSEIDKKRAALENVLVPYSVGENIEMLEAAKFCGIEIAFKWVNFAMFVARKD